MRPSDPTGEIRARLAASTFHREVLPMSLEEAREGEVAIALEADERHLNLVGTVHGGVIATLADTAASLAYRTILEPGTVHVTTHLSVAFLAPGRPGKLLARGRVIKHGRRVGYAEAEVSDGGGRLLARASALFAIVAERTGPVADQ